MNTTQHTPLAMGKIGNDYDHWTIYDDKTGRPVCNAVYGKEQAERIVISCNAHAALVDVCRRLEAHRPCTCGINRKNGIDEPCITCAARAALRLAEGGAA